MFFFCCRAVRCRISVRSSWLLRGRVSQGGGRAATSSVINRIGHYDEIPARRCAESLATALGIQVVCACGIHTDQADAAMIKNILAACDSLTRDAEQFLRKNDENL